MASDPPTPPARTSPLVESPSADQMEGAPGPKHDPADDGQLGPDELSDPDEIAANRKAKLPAGSPPRG